MVDDGIPGALFTAATYHILVNDQAGFLGAAGRWAIRGEGGRAVGPLTMANDCGRN